MYEKMKARVISTALAVAWEQRRLQDVEIPKKQKDGKGEKGKCRSCAGILSRILP